jgi:NIPSNAP
MTPNCWQLKGWKTEGWSICAIALFFFVAGSLMTARWVHETQVSADSNRVFEMHIYHTVPGKAQALEARFRDTTSKLLAKHDLNIVGYWVAEDTPGWDNNFIFIVAHSSREEAKKNWDAMRADPKFQEVIKSERANKTVEKIDVVYMRPTDFSPMK